MNYDGEPITMQWYISHGWEWNGTSYVSPSERALAQYSRDLAHYKSLPWWRRIFTPAPRARIVKLDLPHE